MSTIAYRAGLVRHINQKIDTADRMLATIREKNMASGDDYYRGFREACIELLTVVDDMEDQ